MNERILQLAKEAGLSYIPSSNSGPLRVEYLFPELEKFADLIVKEVIKKIEAVGFKSSNDIPFEITELFVSQIKQHLGVQ